MPGPRARERIRNEPDARVRGCVRSYGCARQNAGAHMPCAARILSLSPGVRSQLRELELFEMQSDTPMNQPSCAGGTTAGYALVRDARAHLRPLCLERQRLYRHRDCRQQHAALHHAQPLQQLCLARRGRSGRMQRPSGRRQHHAHHIANGESRRRCAVCIFFTGGVYVCLLLDYSA